MITQLNDIFPDWLTTGGIFTLLSAVEGEESKLPWDMDANLLDMDYHGNHSGGKIISPLLYRLQEADNGTISVIHKAQLALLIYNKYIDNWTKRWNALQTEYKPLENYSMLENLTDDDTTVTHGKTTTRTGSVEMTPEAVMTVESSVYAYDSSNPSPDAKTVSTPEGSNTTEYNDLTDTEGGRTKTEHGYEKTRSGNIGVTTSQQMLQAELEIRTYDYYLSVFEDIDKVLTIPVY